MAPTYNISAFAALAGVSTRTLRYYDRIGLLHPAQVTAVRSQLAMEGKIGALTAQGKLQALVVGMLPLALLLVLDRMEPEAMAFLWHSPPGWATLAVIATLEVLGVLLIRRIVAIDV